MLTTTAPSSVLAWLLATTTATATGDSPPVELLWATQAVTLLVGLASGWFALRTKRGEVDDTRQARFDARIDRELDEALAAVALLRHELQQSQRRVARSEAYLIRAGINPTTGRKEDDRDAPPPPHR